MNITREKVCYRILPQHEALFCVFLNALGREYKIKQDGKYRLFTIDRPAFDFDAQNINLFVSNLPFV